MDIEHITTNGVYVKKHHFKRGEKGEQHEHEFDHLSIVAAGFVRVLTPNAKAVQYGPGDCITIRAKTKHQVHAITDAVWLCIHRTDLAEGTDPDLIDQELIHHPEAPQP